MADLLGTARHLWRRVVAGPEDHAREAPRRTFDILLVVAIVLVLVWLGREWISEESRPVSDTDRAQVSQTTNARSGPSGTRSGRAGSSSVRLGRCEEVYTAQVRPLKAVTPSMAQWEVHIGAMNKLVVGAISLAQATSFWNQTREGAARNLAEFGHAQRVFGQRTARCPLPLSQAQTSKAVRMCAEVVAARQDELRRAAVALDTWKMHVHHMEMLRRGEMSPEDATRLWLKNWREGDRQVDAYRSAARVAQRVAGSHAHHHSGADGPCG